MVFKSLVAGLLNRFLGDFVDNLDSNQLNIRICGGDVKLENLEVKESALDDFDLPIKLKFGYLESLVLKIPWKNLCNEPVIATIDGLYLIAVPNKGVVYNEDKAKKTAADIKQKTLARLEEARKNKRKPADPQADTFAEKMITRIIKNLQISISNIHVRFEDRYTNRHRPFAAGVTLESLEFKTADENWIPTIHKETVKIIHKLVYLDNLALYWNSKSELISDRTDKTAIKQKLKESIHNEKNPPTGYKYILEPIKMQAKLKLNQKPESDGTNWTTPKIDLVVYMQTLALAIGKLQYQDVLLFLEAQERFTLAGKYLKYRPQLNAYEGYYKE